MYKYYRVLVTSVDYCVEDEDVWWQFDNDQGLEEDSEEYYNAIQDEIARIKSELPQSMELEVECEPDYLDDMVADAISDETGWLVNSFTYDILDKKDID